MSAAVGLRDDFTAADLRRLSGEAKDADQGAPATSAGCGLRMGWIGDGGPEGAVCPSRNTGIAVVMPHADTGAMQKHVDEISMAVTPGAHALIILDKAAWHTTRKLKLPDNLTLVALPPACPELNAAENIWQYLGQTYLSHRVFESYTAILDACQIAWRRLLSELGRIASIASRDWATIG